jgi:hypothetical protein
MSNEAGSQHNGCGHPAKSHEDQQCCVSCPIGLTLLPVNPTRLAFQKRDGENLAIDDAVVASRNDRPPVPPPRVSVLA